MYFLEMGKQETCLSQGNHAAAFYDIKSDFIVLLPDDHKKRSRL
jgi:hypothetical protein